MSQAITKSINFGKNVLDNIISFFSMILREFKKGPKELFAKLEKWLDEIFGYGQKVGDNALTEAQKNAKKIRDARKNGTSDFDWMSSRKTGNLGGNILKESQIRKLRGLLKEKGIDLIVEGDVRSIKKLFKPIDGIDNVDDLFYFMRQNDKVGAFNPYTKQMILPKNTTEIIAFHEMQHVKHFEEIGEATYKTLSPRDKEMYVWREILANRTNWSKAELEDALGYINRVRKKAGITEPIKIK
jgi:hypothetical protein